MKTEQVQGFALSPQQRRLWALQQAAGGAVARTQAAALLAARLDRERLVAAVERVLARHEILRTTYRVLPGMALPVQVVEEHGEVWIERRELGSSPATEDWRDVLEDALGDLASRPLDLASGPLLHLSVTDLAAGHCLLCVSLPSLSADRASAAGLVREIWQSYAAEDGGPLDGAIQYADVAQVFNDLLASEETEEAREHWRRFDPATWNDGLPAFLRPDIPEGSLPARVELDAGLDPQGLAAALSASLGAPERAVWLAGWAAALARAGGRSPLVLGVAVTGRGFEGLEETQGLFARFLPVECRVEEEEPFRALVERLARALTEASDRQDGFSWEELSDPSGGEPPYFSLLLEEGEPLSVLGSANSPGFALVAHRADLERYDLRLAYSRWSQGGVAAEVGYAPAVFRADDVRVLADGFKALLTSALADPEQLVGALEILSPTARRELVHGCNRTALPGGAPERCLHELFEEQADRSPDAPALVFEGGSLTYAELELRANRLAQALRRAWVGPEVRAGVCLERSPAMVVALLGILKAGGAYVPLDPGYPRERLALMIEDARLALLLTAGAVLDGIELPADLPVVRLDAEPEPGDLSDLRPARSATPDNLAYLIYTSGSTGRPKAVLMPHRGIVNRLVWMLAAFPLGERDAVLQKTPFSFDASIWEIFVPLFAGARVVLARPGGQKDASYLLRTVAEQRVTVLQLVPSHLGALAQEEGFAAGCRGLARLFCGGEALPAELAGRVRRELGVELCNLYGPTEAAIDATFQPVGGESTADSAIVPIGRPIDHVRVHLVDAAFRLVPFGLPGELVIAGVGLARGYFGRPDLTAERFVPDPFATEPGGRLYRTGDLTRRRGDGTVEFLGRMDDQVKIRGFRIEPGEITAALARRPDVREAVVVARQGQEGEGGQARLVAYVVPTEAVAGAAEGLAPFLANLRAALQAELPEHMVPADFVPLDALPRSPNGKLDRAALPAPDPGCIEAGFATPRTPVEEMLAGLLGEVLGLQRVNVRASYLELGGHSLLATQVVSRIRAAFQVDLPLRSLFETSSLIELAALIEAGMRAGDGGEAPPLRAVPRDGELPLSFAQQRLWFLSQLQPGSPYFNSSAALRAVGGLDRAALARCASEIVRRHEVLRTTFDAVDGKPVQRIHPPVPLGMPRIDLSAVPEPLRAPEAMRLATEEGRLPFDLSRGPLMRVTLVELTAEEHLILFTLHHITGDGWSTGILTRELSLLYDAFSRGLPSPLPEPAIQYADFAAWQRSWLQGEVLERQLDWWQRQLAGSPSTLRLPTDRARPAVQTSRGARVTFQWPVEVLAEARGLARAERATVFMVVMAAFQALLHLRSGQDDLVVGTDVANRNRVETEGLIGFLVNQLPLRARFTPGITFRGLLAQARETALGAYANQDVPFERMVEAVRPERSTEHAPLFQVKLNLQNVPPVMLDFSGLALSRLEVQRGTSQLDIIVNVEEAESGLRGSLEYNTDLWNPETMAGFLEDFHSLLTALTARPDLPLEEARPLLLEAARRRDELRAQEFADISLQKLRQRARRGAPAAPAV